LYLWVLDVREKCGRVVQWRVVIPAREGECSGGVRCGSASLAIDVGERSFWKLLLVHSLAMLEEKRST
jgi:hypothetical protein